MLLANKKPNSAKILFFKLKHSFSKNIKTKKAFISRISMLNNVTTETKKIITLKGFSYRN